MLGISGSDVVTRLISALIISSVFGYLGALIATRLGDPNPGYDGRLTLNPATHADPLGLLAAVLVQGGWIRPFELDFQGDRGRYLAATIFPLAGLGILIAGFRGLGLPLINQLVPATQTPLVLGAVNALTMQTAIFMAFNLVPLPPLAGGLMLKAVAPMLHNTGWRYRHWTALILCAGCVTYLVS
jgi:Zn-dependent protease